MFFPWKCFSLVVVIVVLTSCMSMCACTEDEQKFCKRTLLIATYSYEYVNYFVISIAQVLLNPVVHPRVCMHVCLTRD